MGLLCGIAETDKRHLAVDTKDSLKSRMRENCTSGSVRGSRQAFHVYKYPERSVETVYSTEEWDAYFKDIITLEFYQRIIDIEGRTSPKL